MTSTDTPERKYDPILKYSIRTPREQRRHVQEQVLLLVLVLLVALAIGVLIGASL